MAKLRTIQILRGTTAQNNAYTGSAGELTMDTTNNEIRVHDGSTQGGHAICNKADLATVATSGSYNDLSDKPTIPTVYHPDLFDHKWADHVCNDVQWLRADTFSWQSGAVYQVAYQHLADDITGKTLQSETISGITVQFYLADDGHKICPASEESNVVSIYSATGVAWYYILDTVNQRFKLPRTKFGFTGLRDAVGKYVEAGLPDHNHEIIINTKWGSQNNNNGPNWCGDDATRATDVPATSTNASASNSIYGNSDTVQPKATQMYLYFYVGNFTQTALENTAGLNASLFNNKADLDFSNTNMIDYVIEKQEPTSANSYTWYRKYKSGWVEQGGHYTHNNVQGTVTTTLVIAMADTHYDLQITKEGGSASNATTYYEYMSIYNANSKTTTSFKVQMTAANRLNGYDWQVSGMAAN